MIKSLIFGRMHGRAFSYVAVVVVAAALLAVSMGCGKKGPPVPPGAQVAPVHYSLNK